MSATLSVGSRVSFLDDEWGEAVANGYVTEVIPPSPRFSRIYPAPEYKVILDSGAEVIAWESELKQVEE